MGEEPLREVLTLSGATAATLLLLAAGEPPPDVEAARPAAAARWRSGWACSTPTAFEFLWVVDFPLFEWDAEAEQRYVAMHHPFTAPHESDFAPLDSEPGEVRARAYDLVLNGSEIGGGSIRIHDPALQARIFQLLSITRRGGPGALRLLPRRARVRHAAARRASRSGLDRIVALLCGETSIRDVIAFPKTADRGGPDVRRAVDGQTQRSSCARLHIRSSAQP